MAIMPRLTLLLVCGLALTAGTLAQDTDTPRLDAWAARRPNLARLFGIGAGGDAAAAPTMTTTAGADADNIPKVLSEYPGGEFSTLLAAVGAADLGGALEGAGPFTVFAPTDDALLGFLAMAGPLGCVSFSTSSSSSSSSHSPSTSSSPYSPHSPSASFPSSPFPSSSSASSSSSACRQPPFDFKPPCP